MAKTLVHSILQDLTTGNVDSALRRSSERIIVPLDMTTTPDTHLNTAYLLEQLETLGWKDNQLRRFLEHGVSYLADVDLQIVLLPP